MEISGVRYEVLDGADEGSTLGELLMSVTIHTLQGEEYEEQPATSVDETSRAALELLRANLIELYARDREEPFSRSEGEGLLEDSTTWSPPLCWQFEVGTTAKGQEVLLAWDLEAS